MRKAISIFMMYSTPFLCLGLGLFLYMHHPLPPEWKIPELLFEYIFLQAWVIGGMVLFPEQTNRDGPGPKPGRFVFGDILQ